MSLTASMIDAMVASGCSAEQMGAIMKAGIAEQEKARIERLEAQRVGNAERQQRFRDKRVTRHNRSNTLRSVTPPIEEIIPPVSSDEETKPTAKRNGHPAKPANVQDQTWLDFCAHRKKKGAQITENVIAGIEREATAAGWTLDAAMIELVNRNWQSFKSGWVADDAKKPAERGGMLASILARQPAHAPP